MDRLHKEIAKAFELYRDSVQTPLVLGINEANEDSRRKLQSVIDMVNNNNLPLAETIVKIAKEKWKKDHFHKHNARCDIE